MGLFLEALTYSTSSFKYLTLILRWRQGSLKEGARYEPADIKEPKTHLMTTRSLSTNWWIEHRLPFHHSGEMKRERERERESLVQLWELMNTKSTSDSSTVDQIPSTTFSPISVFQSWSRRTDWRYGLLEEARHPNLLMKGASDRRC